MDQLLQQLKRLAQTGDPIARLQWLQRFGAVHSLNFYVKLNAAHGSETPPHLSFYQPIAAFPYNFETNLYEVVDSFAENSSNWQQLRVDSYQDLLNQIDAAYTASGQGVYVEFSETANTDDHAFIFSNAPEELGCFAISEAYVVTEEAHKLFNDTTEDVRDHPRVRQIIRDTGAYDYSPQAIHFMQHLLYHNAAILRLTTRGIDF